MRRPRLEWILALLLSFAVHASEPEHSRALFREIGKVIQSPRCLNCHPKGDTPTQGDDMHAHYPPVTRGAHDDGVVGMRCTTCHQLENQDLARVPGAPNWHVAPKSMVWAGRSLH
ncbi:MAG: Isoquinoline 1-oxidoreductase subunit, partial [Bdellovibrionota bacterium]